MLDEVSKDRVTRLRQSIKYCTNLSAEQVSDMKEVNYNSTESILYEHEGVILLNLVGQ